MANLGYTFDSTQIEPNAPRDMIPPGKYMAQIVKSEMKDTSTGGKMLELELDIVEGEFANRKIWDRLNLVNQNAQAQEIAHRTLSAICRSTGKLAVQDSEELHFTPMLITVKVNPERSDPKTGKTYAPSNAVSGYEPTSGVKLAAVPTQPRQTAQPSAAPVAAKPAGSAPPWRKSA